MLCRKYCILHVISTYLLVSENSTWYLLQVWNLTVCYIVRLTCTGQIFHELYLHSVFISAHSNVTCGSNRTHVRFKLFLLFKVAVMYEATCIFIAIRDARLRGMQKKKERRKSLQAGERLNKKWLLLLRNTDQSTFQISGTHCSVPVCSQPKVRKMRYFLTKGN